MTLDLEGRGNRDEVTRPRDRRSQHVSRTLLVVVDVLSERGPDFALQARESRGIVVTTGPCVHERS